MVDALSTVSSLRLSEYLNESFEVLLGICGYFFGVSLSFSLSFSYEETSCEFEESWRREFKDWEWKGFRDCIS